MSDDEGASLQGLIDFYKGSQAYNTILEMATSEMPAEDLKIILETVKKLVDEGNLSRQSAMDHLEDKVLGETDLDPEAREIAESITGKAVSAPKSRTKWPPEMVMGWEAVQKSMDELSIRTDEIIAEVASRRNETHRRQRAGALVNIYEKIMPKINIGTVKMNAEMEKFLINFMNNPWVSEGHKMEALGYFPLFARRITFEIFTTYSALKRQNKGAKIDVLSEGIQDGQPKGSKEALFAHLQDLIKHRDVVFALAKQMVEESAKTNVSDTLAFAAIRTMASMTEEIKKANNEMGGIPEDLKVFAQKKPYVFKWGSATARVIIK